MPTDTPANSTATALVPLSTRKKRAARVLALLRERYPNPGTLLSAMTPWELLVATILAAQCTDERVNKVTPALFARWPDIASMAHADAAEVEEYVRPTGFFRNKAKNIVATAERIMHSYNGEVPRSMKDMLTLPGVARKTANVVLYGAYGIIEGLAVDTHVGRIAYRLGLASGSDPRSTEKELMQVFVKDAWGYVNHAMVWFGRDVCQARKPACSICEMASVCPQTGVTARQ